MTDLKVEAGSQTVVDPKALRDYLISNHCQLFNGVTPANNQSRSEAVAALLDEKAIAAIIAAGDGSVSTAFMHCQHLNDASAHVLTGQELAQRVRELHAAAPAHKSAIMNRLQVANQFTVTPDREVSTEAVGRE